MRRGGAGGNGKVGGHDDVRVGRGGLSVGSAMLKCNTASHRSSSVGMPTRAIAATATSCTLRDACEKGSSECSEPVSPPRRARSGRPREWSRHRNRAFHSTESQYRW